MSNTFGDIYRLTSFGESHGPCIGGVIDGAPAGLRLDMDKIQAELDRRRPGQSSLTTRRDEADRVTFLSGIFEGVTTGAPIGFTIPNADCRPDDYAPMRDLYRPSHADFTYEAKYGIRDYRGGGRASARETAVRVVGGAVARQYLDGLGISVTAYTSTIGSVAMPAPAATPARADIEASVVRCPDAALSEQMVRLIETARAEGDTLGGVVECIVDGVPAGLGEPVFDRLSARLAAAMMSINAAKGFETGMGFEGARRRGSEVIDLFSTDASGRITTANNHSGGIQGGISNGMPVTMRVAFKPVATMMRELPAVDSRGNAATLRARGRHDVCVVPRAVAVVEAMAAMTIFDAWLIDRCRRWPR